MKKLKLTPKFLLFMLSVSLLPLGLITFIGYNNFSKTLEEEVFSRLSVVANSKIEMIQQFIGEQTNTVNILSGIPSIVAAVGEASHLFKSYGIESEEYRVFGKRMELTIGQVLQNNEVYDLLLIATNGDIVYTIKQEADLGSNLVNGRFNQTELARVFNQVKVIREPIISSFAFYQPSQSPAAFVAAPLLQNGQLIGVVALQLKNENLYALSQNYFGLGKSGEIVIAVKTVSGAMVIAPLRNTPDAAFERMIPFIPGKKLPIENALNGVRKTELSTDYRDVEVFSVSRYISAMQWGVVIKQDTQEVLAAITELRTLILVITFGAMLAVVTIAWFMALSITRPILTLSKVAGVIADGELDVQINVSSTDEIGELAGSMNYMVENLRHSEAEAQQLLWINTQLAILNASMSGDLTVTELSQKVMNYLAALFETPLGLLYLAEEDGTLVPVASYPRETKTDHVKSFLPGEGLVGQVAINKKPRVEQQIPGDYITIKSATGLISPQALIFFPLLRQGRVVGIFEFGVLQLFSEMQMKFLRQAEKHIVTGITVAEGRNLLSRIES